MLIKNIYVITNLWRVIVPIFLLKKDRELRSNIIMDLERLTLASNYVKPNLMGFTYAILRFDAFRAVFYYRIIEKHKLASMVSKIFIQNRLQIEISGKIEGGFAVHHGQAAIIHCTSAGTNFSVYQNVTVGRNKNHFSPEGYDKPVIGDNVSIYPGAVVAGGYI